MSSSELDFSTRIRELDDGFTGRQWLINQVNDFLYKSDQQYLVISGEPGIGKSAIAAHVVRQGKIHGHHFCRAQEGTTLDPIAFVRSLTHQLVRRVHDFGQHVIEPEAPHINVHLSVGQATGSQIYPVFIDQFVIEARDAGEVFRRLIAEPLKRWASARSAPEPIVLLVDGLDEAMKLERHPNIFDLIERARDLPREVRWVLTSRPGEHLRSLRGARLVLSEDSEEQQADIRSYTSAFLDEPIISSALADQRLDRAAYLDLVTRRSEGNFLYLKLAFAQLRKTVAANKPLAHPAELPAGLEDLYREYLDRLTRSRSRDTWRNFFRPVVRILAVARDALGFDELALLSGVSPQSLNDLLSEMAELLDSGPKANGPYRLHHASFADFITDRARSGKFWIDAVEGQRLISDVYLNNYGTNWENCSDYGLGFLVHHLTGAGRQTEIHHLLIDEAAWTRVKVRRLGERLLQDDLETAFESFTDPVSGREAIVLVQLWMVGTVAHAWSSAYSDSILKALLALGREQEAVNQARSRIDPTKRFHGLKLLLSSKATDGSPSMRLVNETLIAATAIQDEQQQVAALNDTVRILNPGNRLDELLKSVRQLESVSVRVMTLNALVSWLRESEDARAVELWKEALQTSRGITSVDSRAIVLRQLVSLANDEESFRGVLDEARDAAQSLTSANERALCLLRLSQATNEHHKPEAAKVLALAANAAREIRDPLEKARLLHEVGVAQSKLGDKLAPLTLSDAASASTNITSVPRRAQLQEKIACSMGAAGLFYQAVKLALDIPYDKYAEIIRAGATLFSFPGVISDSDHQATALDKLSRLLIAAGKHEEAIATALLIGNIFYRALSLNEIAWELVKQGNLDAATSAARAIDEQAFCEEGERKADDCDYIDAAFEPMDWGRSEALNAILNASLEKGELRRALELLDDYDETEPWSEAMTTIAETLLGIGENKTAIKAIRNLGKRVLGEEYWREFTNYDSDSYPLFLRAAEEAACDDPLAIPSAKEIEDTAQRATALAAIGRSIINFPENHPHYSRNDGEQLLENALDAVCSLREGASKARAARNVCLAMVQADRVDLATRLMKEMKADHREQACDVIVKELLEAGRNDEALRFATESGRDPILKDIDAPVVRAHAIEEPEQPYRSLKDDLESALTAARELDNPFDRSEALAQLAETLARLGDPRAESVLTEALDATQVFQHAEKYLTTLRRLIEFLTGSGEFEEAIRLSGLIHGDAIRAPVTEEIGMALVEAKRFDEAIELAASASTMQAKIRAAVFDARLKAEEFDEALRIVEFIDEEQEKTNAKVRVAGALIHAKRFKKALEIAQSISSNQKRFELLALLASVRAATNRREAMRIVRSVLKEVDTTLAAEDRAFALVTLLDPLDKLSPATASQVADRALQEAEYSRDRINTLSRLAARFETSGDERASEIFDEAWSAAGSLRGNDGVESLMFVARKMDEVKYLQVSDVYGEALCDAARIYSGEELVPFMESVLAGQDDEDVFRLALEASESLNGEEEFAVLMVIGKCMSDASCGDVNDVFDRALRVAVETFESYELFYKIRDILELGDVAELYPTAIEVADTIGDEYDRVELLSIVAQDLARIGMEESVEDVVRAVDDESERRYVQAEVDGAYVRLRVARGNFMPDTWKIVEDIEFEKPREAALAYMGSRLADKVDCDEALKLIGLYGARNLTFLNAALPGVIHALLKAGRVEEAIELARNESKFTAGVNEIAEHLVAEGKLRQALSQTRRQDLDASIMMLLDWSPTLDRLSPGLGNHIVTEAIRVAGWARTDWRDVYEILRTTHQSASAQLAYQRRTHRSEDPRSSSSSSA